MEQERIPVAGGNLLADHRFVLVGARQSKAFAEKNPQAKGTLDLPGLLGYATAKVIPIGNDNVPVALRHIDLFLSLTGCLRKNTGHYIALVGRCELLDEGNDPDLPTKVTRANQYLDEISATLEQEGFEIIRNPVPVLPVQGAQSFYLCALNNTLVEVYGRSKSVWLPNISEGKENASYYHRLHQAEADNARIWESLGFCVRFISGDFHELMDEAGALHCMTNELKRGGSAVLPLIS